MKRGITAAMTAAALAVPTADAVAATAKAKVTTVTKRVTGTQGQADRWGYVQVTLVVKKTTTATGTKKKVTRKIVGVTVPVYPNHTDRSVFINQQALPLLIQEVMHAQFNPNVAMISGATDTSYGFVQSLQAAIVAAKKV